MQVLVEQGPSNNPHTKYWTGISPTNSTFDECESMFMRDCQAKDQVRLVLCQLTGQLSSGCVLPIVKEVAALIDGV